MSSARAVLGATVLAFSAAYLPASPALACTYCSIPVIGGCCGGPGEIVCAVVGCDACMPGTHYDGSTTHCENNCSWGTSSFGNCCGDAGQVICDALSGFGSCKPGLHYDGSTTHCELPCSWGTSSFGNCCGDVGQVHCDVLSGFAACKPDLATGIFTCQVPRTMGQTCGPDYPCADGQSCTLTVDNNKNPALTYECFADSTAGLVTDPTVCKTFYSADVAQGAQNAGIVLSFGIGAQATAAVAGSLETGVFYTPTNQYGCYETQCVGLEVNVGIAAYVVAGQTDTYDDFKGHSFVLSESAGIEVVNYITTQGWNSKEALVSGAAPNSTSQAVSIGIDALPISAGAAECDTIVQLVVGQDTVTPPVAKCQNVLVPAAKGTCQAAASIDNGSYATTTGATLTITQSPASPYTVGVTPVTQTVTDSNSQSATCTANVDVLDVEPPVIACPAGVAVSNAPGQCGGPVTWPMPTASDLCSGISSISTVPASGAFYPVGVSQATGIAVDGYQNSSTCTIPVTVLDTEAPHFTFVPANQVVNATSPAGAVVTYAPFAAGDNCAMQSLTSSPASGSVFPIDPSLAGVTTVTGVATDIYSNVATATFVVHVKGALEQLDDLLRQVDLIRHHEDLEEELMHAVRGIVRNHLHQSCESLADFIEKVGSHEFARRLTPAQVTSFTTDATRIGDVLACPAQPPDDDEGGRGARELARR